MDGSRFYGPGRSNLHLWQGGLHYLSWDCGILGIPIPNHAVSMTTLHRVPDSLIRLQLVQLVSYRSNLIPEGILETRDLCSMLNP
jgi:hypothetical protein